MSAFKGEFVIYQDNNSKRTPFLVKEWCLFNRSKVIKTPLQSSEINARENLCAKLAREVRKNIICNREDSIKALQEE